MKESKEKIEADMHNRITETFYRTKKENRAALVGYITAGDPDEERSFEILDAACGAGLDLLELGIPFSDPTADGPVIQRAASRAIRAGMTLEKGIGLVRRLRKRYEIPIILFTYYNPVIAYGAERLIADAVDTGIDGALVVDLPSENADEMMRYKNAAMPFSFIRLIAPTTDTQRQKTILSQAEGFVYVVSRRGVTGSGSIDWNVLSGEIQELRKRTPVPLCIGFGIASPEDVRSAAKIADGVIVGSAIQRLVETQLQTAAQDVADFVRQLRQNTAR
ncbi:MAG: tryptophan synthase subunit alpha [Planctomycetaceae bacterium]|jgi:tryptophan synthase alpha chain|nr:tryptophan synthase subunit alpha [Planctomycetaceae bacterium]